MFDDWYVAGSNTTLTWALSEHRMSGDASEKELLWAETQLWITWKKAKQNNSNLRSVGLNQS